MLDVISQIGIALFGCSAIWLVSRKERWSKWGFIVGLVGQPFWFYTTIKHKQWAILLVTCWYTYSWAQGIWCHWIKSEDREVCTLRNSR